MNKPLLVAVLFCETLLVGCSERTYVLPPTQNENVEQTREIILAPPPISVEPRRPTAPPASHMPPRVKPTPRPEPVPPPRKEPAPPKPGIKVEAPGVRLHID